MLLQMIFNYKHKVTGELHTKSFELGEVESGKSRAFTEEMESKGYNLERVTVGTPTELKK